MKNSSDSLIFQNQLSEDLRITIHSYNNNAAAYALRCQQQRPWDIETQKNLIHFTKYLPTNAKVLDLGCGPGNYTQEFSHFGFYSIGIDLSEGMIKEAKSTCENCLFVQSDIRSLPLQSKSFEGVWMSASLLHIPRSESKNTFDEIGRILKKGGYLYISTKIGQGEITTYNMGRRTFVLYSSNEINKAIKSSGFDVLEARHFFDVDVKWIFLVSRKI